MSIYYNKSFEKLNKKTHFLHHRERRFFYFTYRYIFDWSIGIRVNYYNLHWILVSLRLRYVCGLVHINIFFFKHFIDFHICWLYTLYIYRYMYLSRYEITNISIIVSFYILYKYIYDILSMSYYNSKLPCKY